jgi:hypothetical protein
MKGITIITKQSLHYKRAIALFILAYVAITIVATAAAILVDTLQPAPSAVSSMQDPGFRLTLPYEPLMNLAIWMACARLYFGKRIQQPKLYKEALVLGVLWLIIALPVDFICFVIIPNPISLSAHDFYVGQFPWIYLTYLAVLLSPLCYAAMVKLLRQPRHKVVQQSL